MKSYMQFIPEEVARLKNEGLFTNIKTLESAQGAWVEIDQQKKLNFCSNNYLGLAAHPEIKAAAKAAIDQFGVGPGAVRTIAGTMKVHKELEEKLAQFKNVEATMVVQSGFAANLCVIPALVTKGDVIYSDSLNHASIIDGCRLSRAQIKVYEHNNMESLKAILDADRALDCRKLIVTDGVFSMDGDIALLDQIVDLAEEYGVMSMVDDAHGEGVLGQGGRGIVDHFGLHGRCDVEVGTFSKALGVMGGCIAGSQALIQYLNQKARPFLFSSALTVPDTAAVSKAVDLLMESEELVTRLWANGDYFKAQMKELGFDCGHSETPITPVMIGDAKTATEFSKHLFAEGIFATKIGFPTVPKGLARIRVMISAAHSKEDLDFALEKFALVGKKMGLIK